jgi:hypothetical protein
LKIGKRNRTILRADKKYLLKGIVLMNRHNFDNIPIPEYVIFLNPHPGPCINRIQKSLANIGVHLERNVMGG